MWMCVGISPGDFPLNKISRWIFILHDRCFKIFWRTVISHCACWLWKLEKKSYSYEKKTIQHSLKRIAWIDLWKYIKFTNGNSMLWLNFKSDTALKRNTCWSRDKEAVRKLNGQIKNALKKVLNFISPANSWQIPHEYSIYHPDLLLRHVQIIYSIITCQAIKSFSRSIFSWSFGCSWMYFSVKNAYRW